MFYARNFFASVFVVSFSVDHKDTVVYDNYNFALCCHFRPERDDMQTGHDEIIALLNQKMADKAG